MNFWRFFTEILCEYESPEEFEKMTEMSGNPPENGQKRDFWHFGQGTTCLNGKKSRKIAILAFSGGLPDISVIFSNSSGGSYWHKISSKKREKSGFFRIMGLSSHPP